MKKKAPLSAGAGIVACFSMFICLSRAQPGTLDITFNPGSGFAGPSAAPVYCIALQTNGQIVAGGGFFHFNGVYRPYIARLNADGSLDSTFGPSALDAPTYALALQPDGKILVGGGSGPARLRPDGSVDTSFVYSALNVGDVNALALQPDGKVVIGGNDGLIARLNTNGAVDATFNAGLNGGVVDAIAVQSNGNIIVGGNFTTVNGIPRNYIARLNPDGSVDTTFDAGISLYGDGIVTCLSGLPQDKVLVGGNFAVVNGYVRNYIARLNADGSVDTTFNTGSGPDFIVDGVAAQSDGKVLIGGAFSNVNGANRAGVARLNVDGSLDLTFNPGRGANNNVDCVASQPDGKTLIGGEFSSFNGTNINGIARLNGDASPTTNLQFMAVNLYLGAYVYGAVSNTYRVEWTSNLSTPSLWTPLLDVTLQTNPQFVVDTNLPAGQRFYRAVQISP